MANDLKNDSASLNQVVLIVVKIIIIINNNNNLASKCLFIYVFGRTYVIALLCDNYLRLH